MEKLGIVIETQTPAMEQRLPAHRNRSAVGAPHGAGGIEGLGGKGGKQLHDGEAEAEAGKMMSGAGDRGGAFEDAEQHGLLREEEEGVLECGVQGALRGEGVGQEDRGEGGAGECQALRGGQVGGEDAAGARGVGGRGVGCGNGGGDVVDGGLWEASGRAGDQDRGDFCVAGGGGGEPVAGVVCLMVGEGSEGRGEQWLRDVCGLSGQAQ